MAVSPPGGIQSPSPLPDEGKYLPISNISGSGGDIEANLAPKKLLVEQEFSLGDPLIASYIPGKCDHCGKQGLQKAGWFSVTPPDQKASLTLCMACFKKSLENALGIKPVGEKRRPCGKCDRMHFEVHLVKLGAGEAAAWFCDPCYFDLIDKFGGKDPERRNILL